MTAAAPQDIKTDPKAKIVCNEHIAQQNACNALHNKGAHHTGWTMKTAKIQSLAMDPPLRCLNPKEPQTLTMDGEPFAWGQVGSGSNCISFQCTNFLL